MRRSCRLISAHAASCDKFSALYKLSSTDDFERGSLQLQRARSASRRSGRLTAWVKLSALTRLNNCLTKKIPEETRRSPCLNGCVNELSRPATERPTDEELARLVAAGQAEVFAQLYERYYARAYRLAWAMTGCREAAEELTQEIFLRAWQKAGQFRGESSFGTWFYRLAMHCCLNFHKRLLARAHEPLDVVEETPQPDALKRIEADVHRQEIQNEVQRALLSLKPKWRLIVILKEIEGLSYEEIAERMNCSTGTVASRLSRSRALLARKLEHLRSQG
jgi:RNA polymerase sigma-70 factor, ECF subfamily